VGLARQRDVPRMNVDFPSTSYRVKGHDFGLDLSDEDRRALIAFLKTL
jgi:hypothetical protein